MTDTSQDPKSELDEQIEAITARHCRELCDKYKEHRNYIRVLKGTIEARDAAIEDLHDAIRGVYTRFDLGGPQ